MFKPEYMYVAGIIPGPTEPHDVQLNHYMQPLIDELTQSYERGVFYSRTVKSWTGCLTQSAILLSVNNLRAACKLAQLGWHRSHLYCTVCCCYHLKTLGRTDCENWTYPDNSEQHRLTFCWRDAVTTQEQCQIWDSRGIRWSELWCLPYWNPSWQLVVDTMHCIFEGLVNYHICFLLNLTNNDVAAQMILPPAFEDSFKDPETDITLKDHQWNVVKKIQRWLQLPFLTVMNQNGWNLIWRSWQALWVG